MHQRHLPGEFQALPGVLASSVSDAHAIMVRRLAAAHALDGAQATPDLTAALAAWPDIAARLEPRMLAVVAHMEATADAAGDESFDWDGYATASRDLLADLAAVIIDADECVSALEQIAARSPD